MTMPDLILSTRRAPAGPVLAIAGELDQSNADRLRAAVEAIALRPGDLLILDLSALTFCDSTGITALLTARNRAQAHAADMALSNVPLDIARRLGLLGLDEIFHIRSDPHTDTDRTEQP
jgi:anti-sigma B factor antagonist